MNLAQSLWQSFQEYPDQIIISLLDNQKTDTQLDYRGLFLGAANFSQEYQKVGITAGEVVILILEHGPELVFAFIGAILHGSVPAIMPFLTEKLSPEHYRESIKSLVSISKPGVIVTSHNLLDEVNRAVQGTPCLRKIILAEQVEDNKFQGLSSLPGLNASSDEVVLLQHSSGTTGLQKGVALSHQAVFNQIRSYSKALKLTTDDVIVSWLPLYHDMGLIAGFILPILSRTHLVLMSPFDWVRNPAKLFKAITDYKGSLCWLPNFAYNFCAQKIRESSLEKIDLSSLRAVINCSEPMHWKSHQMFYDRFKNYGLSESALATCYAMAENVFAVTQGGIVVPVQIDYVDSATLSTYQVAEPCKISTGDAASNCIKMLSAGRPIENTQIRIIDSDGNSLPMRHIGEIIISSDCLLSGYYHRPDLTGKAFLDDWYLTGDLGYLADGELYITGRKKDLIIVGGKNIYPQDLEHLAGEIGGLYPGRVVAFGLYNEKSGTEEVVIVAELEHDNLEQTEREQIANLIRQRVTQASDITLRYVHLVKRNWLIKTSSGKIARNANRDKYIQEVIG